MTLCAIGIEMDKLRICLLENVGGQYRLATWLAQNRIPDSSLAPQVAELCRQLGRQIGRRLWDEEADTPFLHSDDPVRFPHLDQVAITASPRPRLRVTLAGLTGASIEAARLAVHGSPARVTGILQLTAAADEESYLNHLIQTAPDVVVIAGQYDVLEPAAHHPLLTLCTLVGRAVQRLPRLRRPALIYAGNRWIASQVERLFRAIPGLPVQILPNVMPAQGDLRQDILAHALTAYYWQSCRKLDGVAALENWVTGPSRLISLESSFARMVHAWMEMQGLSNLHALYCLPERWLHVWTAGESEGLHLHYLEPNTELPDPDAWPPLQLLCGPWPDSQNGPPPNVLWWDRSGLAPVVAALGQTAPSAMIQALHFDLLQGRQPVWT